LNFARHGCAAVVIADRRSDPREGGTDTHDLIRREGAAGSKFVACDVQVSTDVDGLLASADEYGHIDILVNTAGIPEPGPFLDTDPDSMERLMAINVIGAARTCQAVIPEMISSGGGSIINTSSVTALRASHGAIYSASKAAVALMSASLAAQFGAYGIRVNCLHPGFIATAMTSIDFPVIGTPAEAERNQTVPLGRTGQPEDVANAALFLASDESSFVTGTGIVVDGGWSCQLPAASATSPAGRSTS
jgi:NAD(P)-dependent dehydrogenase (short-subunit alcohol dehydrogenase family)